jgi:hypothetical protein
MEVAVELDDSLHAKTGTTMSWGTVLEGVNVVLDGVDWDFKMLGSLDEHLWDVDSLSSRSDLLTSHEEIVRVGVVGVSWVQHCIEWTGIGWVSIEHVEISLVFLLH